MARYAIHKDLFGVEVFSTEDSLSVWVNDIADAYLYDTRTEAEYVIDNAISGQAKAGAKIIKVDV